MKKTKTDLFNEGFIQIHRKMLKWEWYDDPNTFRIFMHCLLKANWKDKKWRGVLIKRGSFITGRNVLSKELGISSQSIRTSLTKLKSTNELTIKTTNKYSVVTVSNYNTYQQVTSQPPHKQPTTNQQLTTTNKDNKDNKKDIETFISHFNTRFSKRYQETKGRELKLKARLKTYTMDQLLEAIDKLSESKFHIGQNDNNWEADPDFLLRSDEQVDKWRQVKKHKTKDLMQGYTLRKKV